MIASRAGMAGHSSSYFPYVKLVTLILYIRQSPIIGRRLTMELNWPLQQRPCHFSDLDLAYAAPRPRPRPLSVSLVNLWLFVPPTGGNSHFVAVIATVLSVSIATAK